MLSSPERRREHYRELVETYYDNMSAAYERFWGASFHFGLYRGQEERSPAIAAAVVLSGDIHSNWANELIADFDDLDSRIVAHEFVGTSISSGYDGLAVPKNLDKTYAENPFVRFHNAERGYVLCEANPKEWRTDYRTVPFVIKPGAPIQTRASVVIESGTFGLKKV